MVMSFISWLGSKKSSLILQMIASLLALGVWSIFGIPYSSAYEKYNPEIIYLEDNLISYRIQNNTRLPRIIFEYNGKEYHAVCFGKISENEVCQRQISERILHGEQVVFLKAIDAKRRIEGIFLSGKFKDKYNNNFNIFFDNLTQDRYLNNRENSANIFYAAGWFLFFYFIFTSLCIALINFYKNQNIKFIQGGKR